MCLCVCVCVVCVCVRTRKTEVSDDDLQVLFVVACPLVWLDAYTYITTENASLHVRGATVIHSHSCTRRDYSITPLGRGQKEGDTHGSSYNCVSLQITRGSP